MKSRLAVSLIVLAGLGVAACGSDDSGGSSGSVASGNEPGPAADVPAAADLDNRSFLSSEVTGHELVDGTQIQLAFEANAVAANAGCNGLSGGFSIDEDAFTAGPFAMTQMACDQALMDQDMWLGEFLSGLPRISLVGTTLTLQGTDATVVFEELQNAPVEGTTWIVSGTVANEAVSSVPAGAEASLVFTDGSVQVHTGCNTGSGDAEVAVVGINFGPIATTRMACTPELNELEASVLAVLDGDVAYQVTGDTLSLRKDNGDGTEIGLELTAS